jgi:Uma2 family endonuclease
MPFPSPPQKASLRSRARARRRATDRRRPRAPTDRAAHAAAEPALHLPIFRTPALGTFTQRWLANVVGNDHQQVRYALTEYSALVTSGSLYVAGAVYDFRSDLGRGLGRLAIVNVNGEKRAASHIVHAVCGGEEHHEQSGSRIGVSGVGTWAALEPVTASPTADPSGAASRYRRGSAGHVIIDLMSAPAPRHHYTLAEYLSLEAFSDVKHEYLDGEIYAMAGGTPEHSALVLAVGSLIFAQIRGGRCRALDSNLRVRVPATGLDTYPDVTVVCGPWERDREDELAVVNPVVIVEVLSRSTEEYDRGSKFEHYRQLDSLREYVLVSQTERRVEVRRREVAGTWISQVFGETEVAMLESIGARIDIRELYEAAAEPPA